MSARSVIDVKNDLERLEQLGFELRNHQHMLSVSVPWTLIVLDTGHPDKTIKVTMPDHAVRPYVEEAMLRIRGEMALLRDRLGVGTQNS